MDDTITPFGQVDFRDDDRVFGIRQADRRYHLLTIGKTGAGKSSLLLNLIRSDLQTGQGVALFDPHGDLAEAAAQFLPDSRNDVLLFRPGAVGCQLTFNPLHISRSDQRHLVVSELITVFQQIWQNAWGPRMEYILRIVLLTLTEQPGHTLLDVLRLLNDGQYRASVVQGLQDDILKRFWTNEFSQYSKGHRTEALAPIQNKLGEFLVNPILRQVVDDPEGNIHPRAIMDEGGVFIADLSVGRLGRDVSMLLGATLVGKFALAALSRSDTASAVRRDFYLYIDEFPLFATASLDTMLSEARKYRLNLVLAMQYLDQLDKKLLGSVLGNVGNLVVFRLGADDANRMAREFDPVFSREDILSLPYHHAFVRMMIDGKPSRPFSAKMIKPLQLSRAE